MASPAQLAALAAVVPAAQASARRWGVPASVTLAQWIFESSWGTSELALEANNCFGVKCTGAAGPENYMEFPTAEYAAGRKVLVNALFAKYASVEQSFAMHAALLATAARYRHAMECAGSPYNFAHWLQACGYSTNPNYAEELINAIRLYNLTQYDLPAMPAEESTHG